MRLSTRTGFWMLTALLALFAAAKAVEYSTLDPDCFWHLRVADQLHRDGIGPIMDDLSFASSRTPWTPYSWLAELGMKAVWDHGGYRAAVAVTAIAQAAIIVLLAMCCLESQRENRRYLAAVVATAIGEYLILPYLSFRPVTFAFVLLFAIGWLVLRDLRKPSALVWLVIPLTVLLTNIHLFSFFVPAMLMVAGVGEMLRAFIPPTALPFGDGPDGHAFPHDSPQTRPSGPTLNRSWDTARASTFRYGILATTAALACLTTPMLPGLIRTIFFYSAKDKMVTGPIIVEMQSFIHGNTGWIALSGLIAILFCIAARYHRVSPGQLIAIAATTLLMLKLGRFAPMFALAACPALAATIPGLRDRVLGRPMVIGVLGCILFAGIARIVFTFPSGATPLSAWVNRHGPDTPGYPCAAADFLDRSITASAGRPAHLINEFSWGGYLAWRLQGKYQVLLDGRTQVYPQSLWQATYLGTDADRVAFLSKIPADAALLPAGGSTFRAALTQLGWRSVYKDDRAEVLVPPSVARLE